MIYGMVCTKDEADRYLDCALAWHSRFLDGILVYDDSSTDLTREIAVAHGCVVVERPSGVPTLLEHEGCFRHAMWEAVERELNPRIGDWILAFDADEFLYARGGERLAMEQAIDRALQTACKSVLLPRPEVWQLNPPMIRVDGYWGAIRCMRLFAYQSGGSIRNQVMAPGSEPDYVFHSRTSPLNFGMQLIHYGYAEEADRREKYRRYSGLPDHGHNDAHIRSILGKPKLEAIAGSLDIWRGIHPNRTTMM